MPHFDSQIPIEIGCFPPLLTHFANLPVKFQTPQPSVPGARPTRLEADLWKGPAIFAVTPPDSRSLYRITYYPPCLEKCNESAFTPRRYLKPVYPSLGAKIKTIPPQRVSYRMRDCITVKTFRRSVSFIEGTRGNNRA